MFFFFSECVAKGEGFPFISGGLGVDCVFFFFALG